MGMPGAPFGQQYGQPGVQQMGPVGVNGQQLPNKTALPNNLAQFPAELKGPGTVPNMVSVCLIYEGGWGWGHGPSLHPTFHSMLHSTYLKMRLYSLPILICPFCLLLNPNAGVVVLDIGPLFGVLVLVAFEASLLSLVSYLADLCSRPVETQPRLQ